MHRRLTIILGAVAIVIALCVLLPAAIVISLPRIVPKAVVKDREGIRKIAQKFAEYKLPAGIVESEATDLGIFQDVWFDSYDDGARINFFQVTVPSFPWEAADDRANYVDASEANCRDAAIQNITWHSVPIKGTVTLLLWDCREETALARHARGRFIGKNGRVELEMFNPARAWNWNLLDQFFTSIR